MRMQCDDSKCADLIAWVNIWKYLAFEREQQCVLCAKKSHKEEALIITLFPTATLFSYVANGKFFVRVHV